AALREAETEPNFPPLRRTAANKPLSFFFYCDGGRRDLHSFPTRRSSDLPLFAGSGKESARNSRRIVMPADLGCSDGRRGNQDQRSEEHTSELQSRGHLVCRLLLEKKTGL